MIDSCPVLLLLLSAMCRLIQGQPIGFWGLKVTLSEVPFAGTQRWTPLTAWRSEGEGLFFFPQAYI